MTVQIWLPAETHQRLLEGLPGWARTHKLLDEASEMDHVAGVRRVRCEAPDAVALLQLAERVHPDAAPLIRMAIRRAGATPSDSRSLAAVTPDPVRPTTDLYPEPEPHRLQQLVSVHLLVFGFQIFQLVDRVRELVRRAF